jgi:hypothetical protein
MGEIRAVMEIEGNKGVGEGVVFLVLIFFPRSGYLFEKRTLSVDIRNY